MNKMIFEEKKAYTNIIKTSKIICKVLQQPDPTSIIVSLFKIYLWLLFAVLLMGPL
jgi:hypothetical protein